MVLYLSLVGNKTDIKIQNKFMDIYGEISAMHWVSDEDIFCLLVLCEIMVLWVCSRIF